MVFQLTFLKKLFLTLLNLSLHHIFLLSFDKGIVPTQLKIAKVIPIFKTGDRCNMDNYRPISLFFSKILEKIVANILTNFLNSSNILSELQFGFCSQHSTVHPMVQFTNFLLSALNEKKNIPWPFFATLKKRSVVAITLFSYLN